MELFFQIKKEKLKKNMNKGSFLDYMDDLPTVKESRFMFMYVIGLFKIVRGRKRNLLII